MRTLAKLLLASAALALTSGAALAATGETKSDLALKAKPAPQAEFLLTLPAGATVGIGACAHGWCRVTWKGYSGYARESGLRFRRVAARSAPLSPVIPVFPRYPYHAGHYPTADSYFDLPPYAAINPSFYRSRYFLSARERDRYRYMPHVFRRYGGYGK